MKIESIDVNATIEKAKLLLQEEKAISPSLRATLEILLVLVKVLLDRLNLNSTNSSKPPSTDLPKNREPKKPGERKPGGQPGHQGKTLEFQENPDVTHNLTLDRSELPPGEYQDIGVERRQVIDIDIRRIVTEYQAQILMDTKGNKFVAPFPKGVDSYIQYGSTIKAHSVYLSQYQLIPYKRIEEYFADQMGIPISAGTICRFNKRAYSRLELYDKVAKKMLMRSKLAHSDETGINVNGKPHWLHVVSSDQWVSFHIHRKRGLEAMADMGILAGYQGILVHDHWKPYFALPEAITHALCNAHHERELTRAWEQDDQSWAKVMRDFLQKLNSEVKSSGGQLSPEIAKTRRIQYREIIETAEIECPPPDPAEHEGKRGRQKRSKARNLLERLKEFEDCTLRFMEIDYVPFTNNRAENDLRMSKVQQKISGCFRSIEGAQTFCRVRGYLLTCQRRGISASEALKGLFDDQLPDFVQKAINEAE